MHLSEPIELCTWNGCNLFYANYPAIKLLLKKKKNDVLVTEVVHSGSDLEACWRTSVSQSLCHSPSTLTLLPYLTVSEALSPLLTITPTP